MTIPPVTSPTNPRDLDGFESALLTELREHVASRPATETITETSTETTTAAVTRPRHHRRWAAGLAVAAAGATAFVVASPGGPGASPAYAVSQESDGDVVVTIHRLEDSAGLEAALRDHGIDADVSWQPPPVGEHGVITYMLRGGSAEDMPQDEAEGAPEGGGKSFNYEAEPEGGGKGNQAQAPDGQVADLPDCGAGAAEPATLNHQDDDWVLRIPADSPAQDRHIVIGTASDGTLMVAFAGDDPGSYCAFLSTGG
jgi:hypothetical protein